MQKLTLFNLTNEKLIYFLDSDIICVGDIRACEQFKHFSSTVVFGISLPHSVCGRPMFSGGSFVFEPSEGLYDELQKFALEYPGKFPLADQSILNGFFYANGHADQVHLLGIEWEVLKRLFVHHRQIWNAVADKKFVHFVGKKPWQTSEPGYAELDRLWRRYQ
jgi:lipopolysaccharide biosynthesis glycosyltransferase